jgi:hypothetical protein
LFFRIILQRQSLIGCYYLFAFLIFALSLWLMLMGGAGAEMRNCFCTPASLAILEKRREFGIANPCHFGRSTIELGAKQSKKQASSTVVATLHSFCSGQGTTTSKG